MVLGLGMVPASGAAALRGLTNGQPCSLPLPLSRPPAIPLPSCLLASSAQDLDFFVMLQSIDGQNQVDQRSCRATVTVVDTDKAGTFAWSKANKQAFQFTQPKAFLVVERRADFQVRGAHARPAAPLRPASG